MAGAPTAIGSNSGSGVSSISITTTVDAPAGQSLLLFAKTNFQAADIGISSWVTAVSGAGTWAKDVSAGGNEPFLGSPPSATDKGVALDLWSTHNLSSLFPAGSSISVTLTGSTDGPGNPISVEVVAYLVPGISALRGDIGSFAPESGGQGSSVFGSNLDTSLTSGALAAVRSTTRRFAVAWVGWNGATTWTPTPTVWTSPTAPFSDTVVAYRSLLVPSTGVAAYSGNIGTGGLGRAALIAAYPSRTPQVGLGIGMDGRLLTITGSRNRDGGAIIANLYDSSDPPVIASTVTVALGWNSSGIRSGTGTLTNDTFGQPTVLCRRCGVWDFYLALSALGGTGGHQFFNRKQGNGTWTDNGSASTAAYGSSACWDPAQTMLTCANYDQAGARWGATTLSSVGSVNLSVVGGPQTMVSAVAPVLPSGSVVCRRDGVLLFAYNTTSGDVRLAACRSLKQSDASGAWDDYGLIASGYDVVSLCPTRSGLLVAALWKNSDTLWRFAVGLVNAAGTGYDWSGVSALSATPAWETGNLVESRDGTLWFPLMALTGEVVTLLRCRSLASNGSGTFS